MTALDLRHNYPIVEKAITARGKKRLAYLLFSGIVYFLLARLGMSIATLSNDVAIIWPATGWGIATVWMLGPMVVPFLFLAEFASSAFKTTL